MLYKSLQRYRITDFSSDSNDLEPLRRLGINAGSIIIYHMRLPAQGPHQIEFRGARLIIGDQLLGRLTIEELAAGDMS